MKKISLYTVLFCATISISKAQNPFASIGKTTKPMLTLSNGRYEEHFENDSIRQVGSVMVNIKSEKIVAFVDRKEQANKVHAQTTSRFLSIDPLARNFPFLTPYQYADNTPIQAIDLDGLESFKINDNSVTYFDEKLGQLVTYQRSCLILTDPKGPLKVVDENDVELNNFKYCTFACQMQNFEILQQIPSGEGDYKLSTPNLNQGKKLNTSSTFLITTDKFDRVGFKANEAYSFYFGVGAVGSSNLEDRIADVTQKAAMEVMRANGKTEYNSMDDVKQFSILRIVNGTNATKDDIIKNLKEQGFYHDKLNVEYTELKSGDKGYGTMSLEYGNYECNSENGCK